MKIASATYGSVLALSLSANAVTQAIEHHAHPNLKGGKRFIKRDTSLIINVPESVTLTGSSSSTGTSIDHLFSKFAYEVAARVEIPLMYDFSKPCASLNCGSVCHEQNGNVFHIGHCDGNQECRGQNTINPFRFIHDSNTEQQPWATCPADDDATTTSSTAFLRELETGSSISNVVDACNDIGWDAQIPWDWFYNPFTCKISPQDVLSWPFLSCCSYHQECCENNPDVDCSFQFADPVPANPNDPTAPGAQLVDVGQSCCGECWCIEDGVGCPLRTTAFPQLYTEGMVSDFGQKTLVDPDTFEVVPSNNLFAIECDPYDGVSRFTSPPWKAYNGCELTPAQTFDNTSAEGYDEAVCAFSYPKFDEDGNCDTYTYKTYASAEEAEEDGAYVTHHTQCGVCSSAQDLAVFLNYPDLTDPGIQCGLALFIGGLPASINCYMDLGFTEACATIWAQDSQHTSKPSVCLTQCLNPSSNVTGPPPECALNDCVECDDTKSGPTFNAYSGRTRRNSGIWSGLARSCSSIQRVLQNTCPPLYAVPDEPICQAQQICTLPNPLQQNQCE